jgi:HEAT repeat protein
MIHRKTKQSSQTPVKAAILLLILTSLCLLLVGCSKERRAERLAAKLGDPFGFAEVDDLVKIGPPAVEPLIAALKDENMEARRYAAEALGRIGDARAIDPLIAALEYDDGFNPSSATLALVSFGSSAVDPLITALEHENGGVRMRATQALGMIGDIRAIPHLIAVLEELGKVYTDPMWYETSGIGAEAEEALVKMGGNPETVESLIGVLQDGDRLERMAAARILGQIGDRRAVEPLVTALEDEDEWVRVRAAEALAEFGDTRAVDTLIAALGHEHTSVRESAAEGLGKIGDAHAVDALVAALGDDDPHVRRIVARTLQRIGSPGTDPLIAALKEERLDVVAQAYLFFLMRGVPGTEATLIKALERYGTKEMALDLLNCGNDQLEDAARAWATRHGYEIVVTPGSGGVSWGGSP